MATSRYDHEGLRRLSSPAADAAALAAVLGDPGVGGFDVTVLQDAPAHEVEERVEDLFADARPDDVLLLHFSCHGLKSESGDLYLAARDTRPDRLASTAVHAGFVQRCMGETRSRRVVLLLDCCYGGAFGRGVRVRAAGDVDVLDRFATSGSHGRGRAVITASSAMEYAFEGDRLAEDSGVAPSVFTSALVRGLSSGDADRDEDGLVSLDELYDYVFAEVTARNPHQTPSRDIEMQGELYVARSSRRRVEAAPLPADLDAASRDASMYARLGAVRELQARLTGPDVAAAAGAYLRLAEMARTDIGYVTQAATDALAGTGVQPSETEVDFGEVPAGTSVPPHTVRLLGPAVARACSFRSSHWAVSVEAVPEGFAVRLDASRSGEIAGTITVTGPTGTVELPVTATVLTAADRADASPPSGAAEPPSPPPAESAPVPVGDAAARARRPPRPRPRRPPPAAPQPRLLLPLTVAAGALASAALLVLGLVEPARYDDRLDVADPDLALAVFLAAVVAGVAGLACLVPRARTLAGPALTVGAGVSGSWVLEEVAVRTAGVDGLQRGTWLVLVGATVLTCTALAALVACLFAAAPLRTPAPATRGTGAWLLTAIAVAGVLSLAAELATYPSSGGRTVDAGVWLAVLAVLLPVGAVWGAPRPLQRWLLLGWALGAGAITVAFASHLARLARDQGTQTNAAPLWVFAATLVALVVVAVLPAPARAKPDVTAG